MYSLKIRLVRRMFLRSVWGRKISIKPSIPLKMTIYEKYPCQLACKYLNENFSCHLHSFTKSFHESAAQGDNGTLKLPREFPADIDQLHELSDDEFKGLISQLRDIYSKNEMKFKEDEDWRRFLNAIDTECVRRSSEWDLNTNLAILEKFHPYAKYMCNQFLFLMVKKKFVKAMKAPIPTMLKYLTIIDYYKFWRKRFMSWFVLQHALTENFDRLTTDEISIVLSAFCGLNGKPTSQDMMPKLLDRLMNELETVKPSTLYIFLKFFALQLEKDRSAVKISFDELLNSLEPKLAELSIASLRHVSEICYRIQNCNPAFIDKVAGSLIKKMPNLSAAQLEDIMTYFVNFNFNTNDLYKNIVDNFKKEPLQTSLEMHPKRLVKILGHLAIVGVYPLEYVNMVLSTEFLHKTFGKRLVPQSVLKQIMVINEGVQLECPDYKGNKLDDTLRQKLLNYWSSHIHPYLTQESDTKTVPNDDSINPCESTEQRTSLYNATMFEVRSTLTSLLGGIEYVHTCYVLPFLSRPNLLFALDEKRTPIKLPAPIINVIRIDDNLLDKSLTWYVILCANEHPMAKGAPLIMGNEVMKLRILQRRDYKPVVIVNQVWMKMNQEQRLDYLKQYI